MAEARELMLSHAVDGVVLVPADFARRAAQGDASVQILVDGVDGNTARIIEAYAEAAVAQTGARTAAEGQATADGGQAVIAEPAVVQRRQRQPLFPGARPDRADHHPDRRAS